MSRRSTFALVCWLLGCMLSGACGAEDQARTEAFARTLYLVRHGAYDAGQKAANSEAGPGLTPLGIAQARLIAARLRGMPVHFASMTSSTMTRAKETAAVMHETLSDVPMSESASLTECTPPTLKPPTSKERADEATQCQEQLEGVFKTYFVPATRADESDIIVAHGNVIRFLVMKALGVDTRAWAGMAVAHASVTVIRVRANGSMAVLSVGDTGHIPPNLQSWGSETDPQLVVPPFPR